MPTASVCKNSSELSSPEAPQHCEFLLTFGPVALAHVRLQSTWSVAVDPWQNTGMGGVFNGLLPKAATTDYGSSACGFSSTPRGSMGIPGPVIRLVALATNCPTPDPGPGPADLTLSRPRANAPHRFKVEPAFRVVREGGPGKTSPAAGFTACKTLLRVVAVIGSQF